MEWQRQPCNRDCKGQADSKTIVCCLAITAERITSTTTYGEVPRPRPRAPQRPGPHGQYVVTPHVGLNVRNDPSIEARKEGATLSGSFVQATGKTSVDASGNKWMQVQGTDMNDQHVEGWAEAQYITPHPQGALAGTGRIDPTKGHRTIRLSWSGLVRASGKSPLTMASRCRLWRTSTASISLIRA